MTRVFSLEASSEPRITLRIGFSIKFKLMYNLSSFKKYFDSAMALPPASLISFRQILRQFKCFKLGD